MTAPPTAYLVGFALALVVWAFARIVRLDRDGAFYPTVAVVSASYYVLFAVMGGSMFAVAVESIAMTAFVAMAVGGFKVSPWLVVVSIASHGVFDVFHGHLVTNAGVPGWWPAFCLTFDVTLGGVLAWIAAPQIRPPGRSSHGLAVVLVLTACSVASGQTSDPVAATPAALPVTLGLDGHVASWLQVRGEVRTRIEGYSSGGFAEGNDDAYWLNRFRLDATIRPTPSVAFVLQAQDARAFDKSAGSQLAPFRDSFQLRTGYLELGQRNRVRVGRQELSFGEQRLLGPVTWTNTAKTVDGARLTLSRKDLQLDAFAVSPVTIRPDAWDDSGGGNAIYGLYASFTIVPKQVIEPYVFWRRSSGVRAELGGTAPLHQTTVGGRIAGKLPLTVDYSLEATIQGGSVGVDAVRASAVHALLGKTFGRTPRMFAEYNYASGDGNRTDGVRETFGEGFLSGHDKLGLSDLVGWRNIRHARVGVDIKPQPTWQISASYHSWWLASATDGLYNAGGALVARSPTGAAGSHVGQEIDAQATYTYSRQLQFSTGYAYIIPGEFLKHTTPGHAYSYPFLMVTYVFLGEHPAPVRKLVD